MQIQMIEEKTGLDRATIRYYEQEGLIIPQRLQNGYRDYSENNLQDLLKIKFLRQLGLSLETIQQLIEGNEILQNVLGDQLSVIAAHKDNLINAELVCKMMIQDHVTYQTFQPSKYINAIEQDLPVEHRIVDLPKTEYVYSEAHPFRRFLGRYLDHLLSSALLMLILIVFVRIRPAGDILNIAINIGAIFLSMLLNALFLCTLGTTPGKFAMGISLLRYDGKNLSFFAALQREWAVFRYGEGFRIPGYSVYRLYKSFKIHSAGLELEWDYDYDVDIIYTYLSTRRAVYASIMGILCTIAIVFSAYDSQLPKHRGEDLSVSQFAVNYNNYAKLDGAEFYLSEGGEWYRPSSNPGPVEIIDPKSVAEKWDFITDSEGKLNSIIIELKSESGMFLNIANRTSLAVYTALMSQPNTSVSEVEGAINRIYEIAIVENLHSEIETIECNGVTVSFEIVQTETGTEEVFKMVVTIVLP